MVSVVPAWSWNCAIPAPVVCASGLTVKFCAVASVAVTTMALYCPAVVGVPDPEWGEAVVACHPGGMAIDPAAVAGRIAGLAGFKRPKRYVALADWPRNAEGKLNRAALRAAVLTSPSAG